MCPVVAETRALHCLVALLLALLSGRFAPYYQVASRLNPSPKQRTTPMIADTEAQVGLLEGMATTRAIRRYTDELVSDEQLQKVLFAATRAPSGSNRQPFRFLVLRDSERAREAKALIGGEAQRFWADKRAADGYDSGSGSDADSPKARMARTMEHFVDNFATVPVLVLPCLVRYRSPMPTEGASIYPACQNLLLAARAVGLGGVLSYWHSGVESDLRSLLEIPEGVWIAATITLGYPAGSHGSVRRRPLNELVYEDVWDGAAAWAADPPGTRFTSAGPPKRS
jgi:nitroreductase